VLEPGHAAAVTKRRGAAPRRVFIVIHDDYAAGGLQRSAMAVRQCLTARGFEVTIYCLALLPGGLAEKHDFVRELVTPGRSRLIFWLSFLRGLRDRIRTSNPEAVIGLGLAPSIAIPIAAAGQKHTLLIGSERAYPPAVPAGPGYAPMRRITFPHLDRVVCQTEKIREWFLGHMKLDSDKVVVIPNVVQQASPPYARDPAPSPMIVCAGRMTEQKGFDVALRAFVRNKAKLPEAKLIIAGEGPLEEELRSMAAAFGVAESVDFCGPLPSLEPLWAKAWMLMFPSRYEGFPNVLAEAMAHGVPVVAADCPTGPSDMIEDGVNGYLVPVGDAATTAEASLRLLSDPGARETIGRAASAIAERYSAEHVGGLWEALVEGGKV
jgi:glycosyltransferase involved in cell wall biosynthesis